MENNAARIEELERQLRLSDEGVSRLAQRCLELEQELQASLAAHPRRELKVDSPLLLQPTLYFDAGLGFSQRDTLAAPDSEYDEASGAVTVTFELPVGAQALRFDPGELPCCVVDLSCSDERVLFRPNNGLELPSGSTLFLSNDPNFRLEGLSYYPAGTKLTVAYNYFPLERLAAEPLFRTMLETVQHYQRTKDDEAQHIANLNQIIATQQSAITELQATVARLNGEIDTQRQANAALSDQSSRYEAALDSVLTSSSWKLTAPLRRLLSLFRRG